MSKKTAIITGAGGFIGSHFAKYLKQKDYHVIGIDIKKPDFSKSIADTFIFADLRSSEECKKAFQAADELYMLAADMGGVGHINTVHAEIMYNNTLINTNSLHWAKEYGVKKVFFSSSACVYPESKQNMAAVTSLKEADALPAEPDTEYGWEKLFTEMMCLAYAKDHGMEVRIARFHNIFGPEGTYQGGREKSPAAICRKVALAKQTDSIEVWGDGEQTRSYCYIDDCCEGIYKLMQSSHSQPINIGSDKLVTINQLVDIVAKIAGKSISKKYATDKPQGVRGRNSDNTLLKKVLGWEPQISLEIGLQKTYVWIEKQILNGLHP